MSDAGNRRRKASPIGPVGEVYLPGEYKHCCINAYDIDHGGGAGSIKICPGCRLAFCLNHWFMSELGLDGCRDSHGEESPFCYVCDKERKANPHYHSKLSYMRKLDERKKRLDKLKDQWGGILIAQIIRHTREFWVEDWVQVDPLLRMVMIGHMRRYTGKPSEGLAPAIQGLPEDAVKIIDSIDSVLWTKPWSPKFFIRERKQTLNAMRTARFDTHSNRGGLLRRAMLEFLCRRGSPYSIIGLIGFMRLWHIDLQGPAISPFGRLDSAEDNASELYRDVFGNPFEKVAWSNRFCTTDVRGIANGIHESGTFDQMPILADALQDAGYPDGYLLNYLRDEEQLHCRGCWAIELCKHGFVDSRGKFAVVGHFSPLVKIEVV